MIPEYNIAMFPRREISADNILHKGFFFKRLSVKLETPGSDYESEMHPALPCIIIGEVEKTNRFIIAISGETWYIIMKTR